MAGRRKWAQPLESTAQAVYHSAPVRALQMVVAHGYLDDALVEGPLRAPLPQPQCFQCLVAFEEVPTVELLDAMLQLRRRRIAAPVSSRIGLDSVRFCYRGV
ncbi:MAG: hypothetical protein HW416_480 [Chloroflexi bacterium]|nr:hypothetical protein [Chloroflexota bacterium]